MCIRDRDNATKVNDAILAIFIAGFTTVMFPLLAEAFEKNDNERIVDLIDDAIGAVFIITIPATVGIMLMATDLIQVMFERNMFTHEDTIVAAGAFFFYSLGLTGMGLRMLFAKVYYSLHDTKTPMINGAIAVAMNIVLNFILVRFMQHRGLALATSISMTVATFILIVRLKKKLPDMNFRSYAVEFLKVLVSAIVMGVVVFFGNMTLKSMDISPLIRIGLVVGSACVVYAVMIILVRVKAVNVYLARFLKR